MAAINSKRVVLGAVAGGVVWTIWSMVVNVAVLAPAYEAAQQAGQLLKEPRYPYFLVVWIVTLFLLTYIFAWVYASARSTLGPGPATALRIGVLLGFAISFPLNFSTATWAPFERTFPLWWMIDLWVGAILATLVAGWLYKD